MISARAGAVKIALRVLLPMLLLGCSSERPLDWTYVIPTGLERADTRVIARIREGGCRMQDFILYESAPRAVSGATETLPQLVQGELYCFEVVLQDASCSEYARSAEMVEVQSGEPPAVVNTLAALGDEVACVNARCDPERGCLPCLDDTLFCAAGGGQPDRCCTVDLSTCSPDDTFFCEPFE